MRYLISVPLILRKLWQPPNKRVANILAKAEGDIGAIDVALCVEPAEQVLAQSVLSLAKEVQPLIAQGEYTDGVG